MHRAREREVIPITNLLLVQITKPSRPVEISEL